MQGTIVMLMALTSLGCHHKGSGHHYAATACYADAGCYSACYGSAQSVGYVDYAPACYATAYSACYSQTYSGCYGATWDACYSMASCYGDWSGCYGGGHKHRGLFSCLKRKRCGLCNGGGYTACYGSWNEGCYSTPVFGAYTPVYGDVTYGGAVSSGQYGAMQGGSTGWYGVPATTETAAGTDRVSPPADTAPATETTPPATDAVRPETIPNVPNPELPKAPEPGTGLPDAGTGSIPEAPKPEI